jgi:hypothetical protein
MDRRTFASHATARTTKWQNSSSALNADPRRESPPTAPHINYGTWDGFPGQTYMQLATQHIHDWVASYVAA